LEKLVVCTVGFDERLVLRSLLMLGVGSGDAVALVYSRSGREEDVRKVDAAVRRLKELIGRVGVEHYDIEVSGAGFAGDVAAIVASLRRLVEGRRWRKIVASVTGGMRLAVVEVIVALALYKRYLGSGVAIEIHVAREDGMYSVSFPVDLLAMPRLGGRELEVLKLVGRNGAPLSVVVESVSQRMGVTRNTAYKIVYRLRSKGLVDFRDHSVVPTEAGKVFVEVLAHV